MTPIRFEYMVLRTYAEEGVVWAESEEEARQLVLDDETAPLTARAVDRDIEVVFLTEVPA